MQRPIFASLLLFFAFSLSAQNSAVEVNCRVLTPEEYGGNGYIIACSRLIDGAFVEVTNLSNMKKSTAVVRRPENASGQGVVSGPLAVNLGIPFNGTADVSVRYISFLKNDSAVYAPFFEEDETPPIPAIVAEEGGNEAAEENPAVSVAPIAVTADVGSENSHLPPAFPTELPEPQWQSLSESKQSVFNESAGAPETEPGIVNRADHLPSASLFEINHIEDYPLKEEEPVDFDTALPEWEQERPRYVAEHAAVIAEDQNYRRSVENWPSWHRDAHVEAYVPEPETVKVCVNGAELGLPHYPEISPGYYQIIKDKIQVRRINPLFELDRILLPQAARGVGVEDPIGTETPYTRPQVDEPQIIQAEPEEPKAVVESQPEPEPMPEQEAPSVKDEVKEPVVITEPEKPYSPLISGALYMQAGAFRIKSAAEKTAGKLNAYFPTVVFEAEENGGVVYKVAVGPISIDEIGVIRLYLKDFRIRDAFPIIGR